MFEFVCTDNGQGMSEDFQKKAFEPFAQEKPGHAQHMQEQGWVLQYQKAHCPDGRNYRIYQQTGIWNNILCKNTF